MRSIIFAKLGVSLLAVSICCSGLMAVASDKPLDTSSEEATCKDIGFRPKSVAFADCVMELVDRGHRHSTVHNRQTAPTAGSEATTPNQALALSASGQACESYGIRPGTAPFVECITQIDQAQQQAQFQQQQYELQMAQYQQQLAAYQAEQQAVKKARQRRKWELLGQLGAGMANSSSPTFLGGLSDGIAAANGIPASRPVPAPPLAPVSQNYSLRLSNGQQIYCNYNTTARVINCR